MLCSECCGTHLDGLPVDMAGVGDGGMGYLLPVACWVVSEQREADFFSISFFFFLFSLVLPSLLLKKKVVDE